MIIPLKELEDFTYTEHINLKNTFETLIRLFQHFLNLANQNQEKRKEFDFVSTLKKLSKNNTPIVHTTYKFSKSLGSYSRLLIIIHPIWITPKFTK